MPVEMPGRCDGCNRSYAREDGFTYCRFHNRGMPAAACCPAFKPRPKPVTLEELIAWMRHLKWHPYGDPGAAHTQLQTILRQIAEFCCRYDATKEVSHD